VKVWRDRFVTGSSHPKEFRKLPPLTWQDAPPPGLVLLVDDVATSGWHLEEALTALRAAGHLALGLAWISGTVTPYLASASASSDRAVDWTAALSRPS
jgi:hypothetical protein